MSNWRRLTALLVGVLVLAAAPASAQTTTYTITGRVLDETSGAPLTGVQVVIRGTRFGGLTNADGRYSVVAQLAAGAYTVEAQMIGRQTATQDVTLGTQNIVTVPDMTMRSVALSLEEVVVTGTAAPTARRAIGNAVSSVTAEQLQDATATTIDQALQGKIAGATITSNTGTPGGGVSVRLRGTSSLVAGAEPLYIVDGVVIDNNADQQVNLGYRSNASNRLADLDPDDIERVEVLKGAAAAALYGSRANNGVVQIFTKRGKAGINRVVASTRMTRSDLEHRIDFALTPLQIITCPPGQTGVCTEPAQRYDNQDLIFRTPWSNDTYLSVSGGSETTQYYLSGNHVSENGIMEGSDHSKLNVRMNLDQRVSNWLNLSAGANYIRAHSNLVINGEQGSGGLLTAIVFAPTTLNIAERDPETGRLVNLNAGTFPNPLHVLEEWRTPQEVNRFVGSFQARANPFSTLRLEYRLGYDQYNMETMLFIPRGVPSIAAGLGRAESYNRRNLMINNDVVASYDFGTDNTRFTTSAGMNHTYQELDQLNATAQDLVPLTELVRGAVQTASQANVELLTLGFFGQQQAAFGNRLYLTGSLRFDASSTFGKDERWQLYPKVSGSWVLSEEDFIKNSLPWFSQLRVRGAFGYAGNQPPLAHAYTRATRFTSINNINRLGLVPLASPGNPNLKPERQREWEAGFDAEVLNGRLGGAFTYYNQYVTDLLLTRPFAPSTGYVNVLDNIGELSNKGIELELSSINIDKPNFTWQTRLIYSRNKNKVEKLEVAPFTAGYTNLVMEGYPVGVHFMPAYMRDANGNIMSDSIGPLLANTPGPIPTSNSRIVGNPWPDWTGSLFNQITFAKNWQLSFLLDGSFGAKLWNQTQRIMDGLQAGPLYDKVLRGEWTPAQLARHRSIWEAYLEDASFIKVRDVTVRYSTSGQFLRHIGASRADFELVGRNLKTFTDYSGYDPEINMFGLSTVERGTDFAVYPNARTIGFGVRLTY